MMALKVRGPSVGGPSIEAWANDQPFSTILVVGLALAVVFAVIGFGVIMVGRLNSRAGLSGTGSDLISLYAYAAAEEAHGLSSTRGTLRDSDGSTIDVWGWDRGEVTVARHDAIQIRWGQWHTDLDLLIEFPAIHDVAHEEFAVRILDRSEVAAMTRKRWEIDQNDHILLRDFETAVDAFDNALRDGEHKATILGRGPSLDPVLKRVMDDAAHLVEILRRPDTSDDDRDRTMRALFKALKPIVGDRAVEIPELEPFVMKQLTTTKTK
ncbi:hypothetical protein BAURA63_03719 [Brevibacterium aurantiacum]|uniref:Uncharacterized protein n=1 Tax=Brevibacterium aurantiacum TaxID=273384 RepID=A0A2H1KTW9_BREAU|nr:hypothetical protein BAU01nite_05290 [Brevibacterium aurantiacum]SMX99307.1 hypothetical protein BAUR9175_03517 [Brevibacterium aurantiacum]SMY02984.1 hypothetical protein BAURA63_03719 [Brevibacterium aurantiacum]